MCYGYKYIHAGRDTTTMGRGSLSLARARGGVRIARRVWRSVRAIGATIAVVVVVVEVVKT